METDRDRITRLIREVESSNDEPKTPTDRLIEAYRIGAETMISEHGIEETARFLFRDKGKSLDDVVAYMLKGLDDAKRQGLTNTFNVNVTLIEGDNATVTINAPAEQKKKPTRKIRKLNFRLINDPSLSFEDRIVYSFAYKWAWLNYQRAAKGMPTIPTTVRKLRIVTGFRRTTVKASLTKLAAAKLLNSRYEPVDPKNDSRHLGYRKLRWTIKGGTRLAVFRAIMATNPKKVNAGWAVKALGIKRLQFYRWKGAGTDDTGSGNG